MVKIYVANLAAYNAGHLIGKWLELPQDTDELKAELKAISNKYGYDSEIEVHDVEGIRRYIFDRYSIIELNNTLNQLEELKSDITISDFSELLIDYSHEQIFKIIKSGDYIIHYVKNDWELGEEVFETFGEHIPDHLQCYFNFEAYGMDYRLNNECKWLSDNKLMVFIR